MARSRDERGEGPAGWIASRLAWRALDYDIPRVANRLPYLLGGLTFAGLLLLAFTGVLLDQLYDPSPAGAHDSVVYILTRAWLGEWVRAVHYWTAGLVVVTVLLHVTYVFLRRSYLPPREVTWWSGVTALLLLLALVFTGTVLRGDQEGGEALAHAIAGARMLGPLGAAFLPDFTPSAPLLARVHNAHVSLLPLALAALLFLHFWLIRHLGIHAREPGTALFREHVRRLAGVALLVMAGVGALGAVAPPGIGYPAVPGVEVTKPFWPFLWIYAAENLLGITGMLAAPALLFAVLYLVPVLDRGPEERRRPRWLTLLCAAAAAGLLVGLLYGALGPREQHLGM